jgi:DNA-binding NarL/FixJ family response regulator
VALPACLKLPGALSTEPPVKFVASAVSETGDEVLACAEAGISGYVGKDGSAEDLVQTIVVPSVSRKRCFQARLA